MRPNFPDPLYFLAKTELAEGNPAGALPLIDRALKLALRVEWVHFLRARTPQALGRAAESDAEFREFRHLEQARIPSLKTVKKGDEEPAFPLEKR